MGWREREREKGKQRRSFLPSPFQQKSIPLFGGKGGFSSSNFSEGTLDAKEPMWTPEKGSNSEIDTGRTAKTVRSRAVDFSQKRKRGMDGRADIFNRKEEGRKRSLVSNEATTNGKGERVWLLVLIGYRRSIGAKGSKRRRRGND